MLRRAAQRQVPPWPNDIALLDKVQRAQRTAVVQRVRAELQRQTLRVRKLREKWSDARRLAALGDQPETWPAAARPRLTLGHRNERALCSELDRQL